MSSTAEETRRLYRIRHMVLQMLRDRGYPATDIVITKDEFVKRYSNPTRRDDLMICRFKQEKGLFPESIGKQTDESIRMLVNNISMLDVEEPITFLVLTATPSTAVRLRLEQGRLPELPSGLPVNPRTKKQGRKVVILKDPCMRLWPVL